MMHVSSQASERQDAMSETYDEFRNSLQNAISAGLEWVITLVRSGDAAAVVSGMGLIDQLQDVAHSLENQAPSCRIDKRATSGHAPDLVKLSKPASDISCSKTDSKSVRPIDSSNSNAPFFFVSAERLVKIAPSQDGSSYYKKSISMTEARNLLDALRDYRTRGAGSGNGKNGIEFTASEFRSYLDDASMYSHMRRLPPYHINLVLDSLVKAGVMTRDGERGKYRFVVDSSDTVYWEKCIEKLKVRGDLLKIAKR